MSNGMCYSVMLKQSVQAYGARLGVSIRQQSDEEQLEMQVYPHGDFPVVLNQDSGEREIQTMRYSLIPRWSKLERPKFATYNARVETIHEKPTWAKPLVENRCLVAFNGFFESCYEGTHDRQVVRFHKPDEKLLIAAGIFESWINKITGELIHSFAIVTTEPSSFIRATGHDRSPLFLPDSAWEEWLSRSKQRSAEQWQHYLLECFEAPELAVESVRKLKSKRN